MTARETLNALQASLARYEAAYQNAGDTLKLARKQYGELVAIDAAYNVELARFEAHCAAL